KANAGARQFRAGEIRPRKQRRLSRPHGQEGRLCPLLKPNYCLSFFRCSSGGGLFFGGMGGPFGEPGGIGPTPGCGGAPETPGVVEPLGPLLLGFVPGCVSGCLGVVVVLVAPVEGGCCPVLPRGADFGPDTFGSALRTVPLFDWPVGEVGGTFSDA